MEGAVFSAGWEVVMEDVPETLKPVIEREAGYFSLSNHRFIVWEPYDDRDPAHKLFHVNAYFEERSYPIGVIELQRLSHNRTLFRIPPRGRWDKRFGFDYDTDGKLFTAVLETILSELIRLGFWSVDEEEQRTKEQLGFMLPHVDKEAGG